MRFVVAFLLSFNFAALSVATNLESIQKGTTIEQVLRQFQMAGIKLLYSNKLVHPAMVVTAEPKSGPPDFVLDQVLQAHGLKIAKGPGDTLLVVPHTKKDLEKLSLAKDTPQYEEQVNVPFVTIYITVKNNKNQFLTNLRPEHFILKEDGVEQKITEFANLSDAAIFPEDAEPITMLMLLDSSASMNDLHAGKRKYDFVLTAAQRLVDQLQPTDQLMLMGFNQSSWVISDLTADKELLHQKLAQPPELSGRTALYDMVHEAIRKMQSFPGRRVLVLCSDGQDSASKANLDSLLKFVRSSDVSIFVLGAEDEKDFWHKGRDVMKKISDAAGGYSFVSPSHEELTRSIDKIRMTLRSQYAAGYIPPEPNVHKWRKVKVECTVPGVKLRYRGEYLF